MTDVAIIGGGPAGSAAAIRLAEGGASVHLFERDVAPRHRICGEFLSAEGVALLRGFGIDPAAHGAPLIDRLRLIAGKRSAETALPFSAYGFTRRAMDAALLAAAEARGVAVERGITVRSAADIAATHRILASGKHDLREVPRPRDGTTNDLIGFKSYFRLRPAQTTALDRHIEIILFDGGYAGLQMVEGGVANLCLLTTRARYDASGGNWPGLLASLCRETPHLETRLAGADETLDRPLTVAAVPYGYVHRDTGDGIYRAGDQFAVIPSFSGDGMSMALHGGAAAAAAILRGEDAAQFHTRLARQLRPQVRLAETLYRLARPRALHPLIMTAARLWPGLLGRIATATRVPQIGEAGPAPRSR
jgi:flavin-dependent dehydrogenase